MLYHFSEEPDIRRFVPRAPLALPDVEALVWTVDAWHAPHYLTPRDCPRVCFWASAASTGDDITRFLGASGRVMAIEEAWLERLRTTVIYRYSFAPQTFVLRDETAGYYVSRGIEEPVEVVAISDLPAAIAGAGIELHVASDLARLHEAVVSSSLTFSSMRLRNAGSPP